MDFGCNYLFSILGHKQLRIEILHFPNSLDWGQILSSLTRPFWAAVQLAFFVWLISSLD